MVDVVNICVKVVVRINSQLFTLLGFISDFYSFNMQNYFTDSKPDTQIWTFDTSAICSRARVPVSEIYHATQNTTESILAFVKETGARSSVIEVFLLLFICLFVVEILMSCTPESILSWSVQRFGLSLCVCVESSHVSKSQQKYFLWTQHSEFIDVPPDGLCSTLQDVASTKWPKLYKDI